MSQTPLKSGNINITHFRVLRSHHWKPKETEKRYIIYNKLTMDMRAADLELIHMLGRNTFKANTTMNGEASRLKM